MSKSSDRFLSFISGVSILGVMLGVLALTVVTSVINGFEGELIRVITGMNGDVLLYSRGEPVREWAKLEEEIQKTVPEAQAITEAFVTELMVAGPNSVAGAVLEGVNPQTLGLVTEIPNRLIWGRMPAAENEVVLGSAIADKLGASRGVSVRLIAPFSGDSAETPRILNARVVGAVKMGMYEYDSKFIFMTLPGVQKFLDETGRVTNFYLKLQPGTNTRLVSLRLSDRFGYPFRAKDWGQLNKNLFYAIKLEKVVIAIILTVIIIVAAFNVVSTLMMMIHDKTKEISILKAMGFRPNQSFQLFSIIGIGIGAVGTVAGVAGGLALGWLLQETRWIQLPPDVYYIGYLPVVVRWREIGIIALVAMIIATLATFYPSWKVSRRSPLDGLRYD